MTSPWWAGFAPAEAHVSCGGGQHAVRWADGRVEAADHPDADGELVIAALGGAATPCLDLVSTWERHCDDLSVLAAGPRSADDQLTISPEAIEELVSPTGHGWGQLQSARARRAALIKARTVATQLTTTLQAGPVLSRPPVSGVGSAVMPGPTARPAAPPGRTGGSSGHHAMIHSHRSATVSAGWSGTPPPYVIERAELAALMALGQPFQFRLSAEVAHAWSADGRRAAEAHDASPSLTAALAGRLAPAVSQWLGIDPDNVEADIHAGTGWGAVDLTRSAGGQKLRADLPVSWLARVWAAGLAVVAGHLVVSVLDAAWPTAQVLALRQPETGPVELRLRHGDGGWSVAD